MKLRAIALALCAGGVPLKSRAGRPLVVDDAYTVAPGVCELEAGGFYERHVGYRHYEATFGLTTGLLPTLEASVGFPSHIHNEEIVFGAGDAHSGIGDFVAGFKWNPLSDFNHWAAHALAAAVKFPTADSNRGLGSGKYDCDLTYIISRNFTQRLSAHANLGYTFVCTDRGQRTDDVFHSGVSMGYRVTENLECMAELYSDLVPLESEDAVSVRGGLRWAVCDSLILDVALGTGLHGDAPEFIATTGFTWSFELKRNYNRTRTDHAYSRRIH